MPERSKLLTLGMAFRPQRTAKQVPHALRSVGMTRQGCQVTQMKSIPGIRGRLFRGGCIGLFLRASVPRRFFEWTENKRAGRSRIRSIRAGHPADMPSAWPRNTARVCPSRAAAITQTKRPVRFCWRNFSQLANQARVVGLIVGVVSYQVRLVGGVAGGMHAGSAAERVHFEAGVIGQNDFSREHTGCSTRPSCARWLRR